MAIDLSKENNQLLKNLGVEQLQMASNISNLTNKVEDLSGSNTRILSYLDNDPKTGKKGMYGRLNELELGVDDLRGFKKIIAGFGAIVIFIGGIFWTFFKYIKG